MNYVETNIAVNKPWRATSRATSSKRAGRLAKGNVSPVGSGATNYGKVVGGTILAPDSNGLLHPVGLADVTANVGGNVNVPVDVTSGFFVGDAVEVRAGVDREVVIPNNSVNITLVPKIEGLLLVIAVAGTSTPFSSSYNPVNKTITINSATNGGGTATTTHAEVVSELLSKFGGLVKSASSATPATVVAALGSTSVGTPKHGVVASSRTVTAVAESQLTLSSSLTCKDGDYVIKTGAYKACGILDETVSTVTIKDLEIRAADQNVTVAYEGDARKSSTYLPNLPGGTAGEVVRKMLGGHVYVDPTTGDEVVPEDLVGFRFLNV